MKDQLQECKAQTQQYEDQADHISKILDQIKTGTIKSHLHQQMIMIPRKIKTTLEEEYYLLYIKRLYLKVAVTYVDVISRDRQYVQKD